MTAIISAVLSMLTTLLPLITSSGNADMIESIITTLANLMPNIVAEVESLVPVVKNIIAALQANPATTESQLAALQLLDQQCDAAFESAAASTDAGQ
jgi:hypothetical protein